MAWVPLRTSKWSCGSLTPPVELPPVGIRTADGGEQDAVDRRALDGQVLGVEEHALGGAAAVEDARNEALAHDGSPEARSAPM